MKFGDEFSSLKNEEYAEHYIDYNLLKCYNLKISFLSIDTRSYVSVFHRNSTFLYQQEYDFLKLLEEQTNKVKKFIEGRYKIIIDKIHNKNFEGIEDDVYQLERFINLNKTAIYKILKKHDKYTNIKYTQSLFIENLIKKMCNVDFNGILISINNSFVQDENDSSDNSLENKNLFVRKSQKFLIKPENISKVKILFAKEFPIKFYHANKNVEYQTVSSIYFDTDTFDLYNKRLVRDDGAKNVRFRWYESKSPENNIYAEIKTHSNEGESSKERVMLSIDEFVHYINSEFEIDDTFQQDKNIATKINKLIIRNKMKPVLRIVYDRTTYENPNIKLTLDTNLYCLKENKLVTMDSFNDYDIHMTEDDISFFNYGILEVKTSNDNGENEVINRLIMMGLIEEVPKFSKYLTCCYNLYKQRLQNMPYWSDSQYFNEKILEIGKDDDELTSFVDTTEKMTKFPIIINPGIIIANERLFLKWLTIGFKILFLGFLLTKNNLIDVSGFIGLICASVGTIGFSGYKFYDNSKQLNKKEPLNTNKIFPLVMTIFLLLIDFVILILLFLTNFWQ